jgi:hypothetical protein
MQMFFAVLVAIANLGMGFWAARLARRGGWQRWPRFRRALRIGRAHPATFARTSSVDKQVVQQTLQEIEGVEQSLERWLQSSPAQIPPSGESANELHGRVAGGIASIRASQTKLARGTNLNMPTLGAIHRVEQAFDSLGEIIRSSLATSPDNSNEFVTASVTNLLHVCGEARGELNALLFEELKTLDLQK